MREPCGHIRWTRVIPYASTCWSYRGYPKGVNNLAHIILSNINVGLQGPKTPAEVGNEPYSSGVDNRKINPSIYREHNLFTSTSGIYLIECSSSQLLAQATIKKSRRPFPRSRWQNPAAWLIYWVKFLQPGRSPLSHRYQKTSLADSLGWEHVWREKLPLISKYVPGQT